MIAKLALRTLVAHPIRTAVLAAGFGTGVSVMAILLGVAQVVLEQARSPILAGGGDVVLSGATGPFIMSRMLLTSTLEAPPLAGRTSAVSPNSAGTVYLVRGTQATPVKARGGVPSRERALGDPEVAGVNGWVDAPADATWTSRDPTAMLRVIDRFHPVPDVPERASSWAEWLYFNGRSANARFYVTFIAGPRGSGGLRPVTVRLQLERNGKVESFGTTADLDDEAIARAPELTVGGNQVRLSGLRYTIQLDLPGAHGTRAAGTLFVEAARGRQLPPMAIHGTGGWQTGYVVPVMSGTMGGSLLVDGVPLDLNGGTGYHDHNWGFWRGVSWQWGQVYHDDISIVFGRVFPPADAADPGRVPGFLGVIGPDGPLGYADNHVTIDETNAPGTSTPTHITVRGRSNDLDMTLSFSVEGIENSRLQGPLANALNFLQMRGRYDVSGTVGTQKLRFESAGSAETFRGEQNAATKITKKD